MLKKANWGRQWHLVYGVFKFAKKKVNNKYKMHEKVEMQPLIRIGWWEVREN